MTSAAIAMVEVLMVEDNRGDVVLVQEAAEQVGLGYHVTMARDGMEAMAYLRRQGQYAEAPRPDLIILDLKLPHKSGREVMAEVMADPSLRRIPLVLLSSSESEMLLARSAKLPEECYKFKPGTYEGFLQLVRAIEAFRRKAMEGQ
jgi:chemotaxis family two-component system response regulator Rcp1